ncbi:MAG: Glu/Leu/Phe/Val dehydrogenase dimerization domain-containing protein [Pseudomonadota bacterium]
MEQREIPVAGWRKVVRFQDEEAGLDAIISVHDDTLGPGCGGCRMLPYPDFDAAIEDVKNLSRGMTFKNALGGIPFGGGKSVIIADPRKDKTPELIKAFAAAVDSLEGQYYTAEDSGIAESDIELMQTVTKYAAGIGKNGVGGNPGPFTARGIWRGMQAAARHRFGSESLDGVKVSIVGVGSVGMALARLVHEDGGSLVVGDINAEAVKEAEERFGAVAMSPEDAAAAAVDIYAPCAFGGAINPQSLEKLQAKVVAGAANNQLATPALGKALKEREILYAPDYVINAMGVISVGLEILGTWSKHELERRTDRIGETLSDIFARADAEDRTPDEVADAMALEIIKRGRQAA